MSAAQKKAAKMKAKSELVRRVFALPRREVVIQNFRCSLHTRPLLPVLGQLYITQHHVAFRGSLERSCVQLLPLAAVASVSAARHLGFPNSVALERRDGERRWFLSGLRSRSETLHLLQHLHAHPVAFTRVRRHVMPEVARETAEEREAREAREKAELLAGCSGKRGDAADGAAAAAAAGGGAAAEPAEALDEQTGADALALVHQIRELAADTMAELEGQADIIDEMAGDVAHVDDANKTAAAQARAIDSVFASAGGASTDAAEKAAKAAAERGAAQADAKKALDERPEAAVHVLFKHRSDALSPALLELGKSSFVFIDQRGNGKARAARKQLRKPEKYSNIACLIARARPFHVDVRLAKGTRFRFMSSHIQQAMTELALRAKLPADAIVFEPMVRKFGLEGILDDDDLSSSDEDEEEEEEDAEEEGGVTQAPSTTEVGESADDDGGATFQRSSDARAARAAAREKKEAEEKARRKARPGLVSDAKAAAAIEQQDRDVDEIGDVLGELKAVADVMGRELERQTAQLAQLNQETHDAAGRGMQVAETIDDLIAN